MFSIIELLLWKAQFILCLIVDLQSMWRKHLDYHCPLSKSHACECASANILGQVQIRMLPFDDHKAEKIEFSHDQLFCSGQPFIIVYGTITSVMVACLSLPFHLNRHSEVFKQISGHHINQANWYTIFIITKMAKNIAINKKLYSLIDGFSFLP